MWLVNGRGGTGTLFPSPVIPVSFAIKKGVGCGDEAMELGQEDSLFDLLEK